MAANARRGGRGGAGRRQRAGDLILELPHFCTADSFMAEQTTTTTTPFWTVTPAAPLQRQVGRTASERGLRFEMHHVEATDKSRNVVENASSGGEGEGDRERERNSE